MRNVHSLSGTSRRALTIHAAKTSALLSIVFVIVYGGTNWFTSLRPDSQIGTWFFEWELTAIPFVPLLIIPYMSIDLFFVGAPFLCQDEHEVNVFAKRVLFSISTATVFFLLMPLTLVWPARPAVAGWFGDLVEASCTAPFLMEFPHNLFPSLHITLSTILAVHYRRHTQGVLRLLLDAWFVLVGVSTILTWQHHLVDVAGGVVVAGFAMYLFRNVEFPTAYVAHSGGQNMFVGSLYALGALFVCVLVPFVLPWGVFLLWPVAALGITSCAYFQGRSNIYRKTGGLVPLSAVFVQAPILLGHYLSFVYYRRQCRAWDEVAPGVLIGRQLSDAEAQEAVNAGVTAVLDLTAEFTAPSTFRAKKYKTLPILDLTSPSQQQLDEAVAFISAEAKHGAVYIHCKAGYSRSATVAGAYLIATKKVATVTEVVSKLRAVRPSIVVRPEVQKALNQFAIRSNGSSHTEHQRMVESPSKSKPRPNKVVESVRSV